LKTETAFISRPFALLTRDRRGRRKKLKTKDGLKVLIPSTPSLKLRRTRAPSVSSARDSVFGVKS